MLVLIEGRVPNWTERLRHRFESSMADVVDRIRWLPALGRDEFLSLLAVSDVVLDPVRFGGGNSSYEALAMGAPVGRAMGYQATAVYEREQSVVGLPAAA